jgi:hypothetical protein
MTVGVYGLVAGIVKLDDGGLYLSRSEAAPRRFAAFGPRHPAAAPWLMKFLSVAGTAAMFLVGGGILTCTVFLRCTMRLANDTLAADTAYRLANEGTALLWRGDFQNARHLLQALARRADRPAQRRPARPVPDAEPGGAFHRHRQAQAQRARVLGALLIRWTPTTASRCAAGPTGGWPCAEAWGAPPARAAGRLLGGVAARAAGPGQRARVAQEGRARGRAGPAARQPHPPALRGVLARARRILQLVADAPLPAMLPRRRHGLRHRHRHRRAGRRAGTARAGVVATDTDPRALACAADNLARLGLAAQVELQQADLFPTRPRALVVCNPPWLPARPGSPLERAVYDEDSRMLRGFLRPGGASGPGWRRLADPVGPGRAPGPAQRREWLLHWIASRGLQVLGRIDTRPVHRKVADTADALHAARAAEVTSLWRLAQKGDAGGSVHHRIARAHHRHEPLRRAHALAHIGCGIGKRPRCIVGGKCVQLALHGGAHAGGVGIGQRHRRRHRPGRDGQGGPGEQGSE